MKIIYKIIITISPLFIWIASLFNKKVSLFYNGRKGLLHRVEAEVANSDASKNIIWFHCSSVGEFEQARPLIEWYKSNKLDIKILLTFFSPSGYELRKHYGFADWVYYLPMDTPKNAKKFLSFVRPSKVIFTKYDLWYNFIKQSKKSGAEIYLISAIFREEQSFFKWWGGFFRTMLNSMNAIFVQNSQSVDLLRSIDITENVYVSGDTRFDRVYKIAQESKDFAAIELFTKDCFAFIAGSTWEPDDKIIADVAKNFSKVRLVIAPHEIDEKRIAEAEQIYSDYGVVRYSQIEKVAEMEEVSEEYHNIFSGKKVLLIDCIGILSSLYKYANFAYIGGGFGVGIHNTLEAAVYGVPIAFGPNYKKFKEAQDLISKGGAISISSASELYQVLDKCIKERDVCVEKGDVCKQYVVANRGATEKIVKVIALPH